MRKVKIILVVVVLFFVGTVVVVSATEGVALLTLIEVEGLLMSDSIECEIKKKASQYMSKSAMQELFDRLGGVENKSNNNILAKVKIINELMNQVFIKDGHHPWSRDDMRVLYMVRASWQESITPECFDEKTNGFSKEEWLRGAVWAMSQNDKKGV